MKVDLGHIPDLATLNTLIQAGIDYHKGLSSYVAELRQLANYHVAYVALGGFYLGKIIPMVKDLCGVIWLTGVVFDNINWIVALFFIGFAVTFCISVYYMIQVLRPIPFDDIPSPRYRYEEYGILRDGEYSGEVAMQTLAHRYLEELAQINSDNEEILRVRTTYHHDFTNYALAMMVIGFVLIVFENLI